MQGTDQTLAVGNAINTKLTPRQQHAAGFIKPQSGKKTKRVKLAEQHGWHCWWCGQKTREALGFQNSASIEHVVPRSCEGPDEYWNKVSACARCNFDRGVEPAEQFAMRARHFPKDRRLTEQAFNSAKKAKRKAKLEQLIAAKAARSAPSRATRRSRKSPPPPPCCCCLQCCLPTGHRWYSRIKIWRCLPMTRAIAG